MTPTAQSDPRARQTNELVRWLDLLLNARQDADWQRHATELLGIVEVLRLPDSPSATVGAPRILSAI